MTALYRLKGMGWFASGVVVALGFYLVSLQVAAERKKLDQLDRAIATAHGDIRALGTEFSTRANLVQLERWNGDVLALSAPTAGQYVGSEQQLAALNFAGEQTPGQPAGAPVQTAQLVIPTLPDMAADEGQAAPGPAPVAPVAVAAAAPKPAPTVHAAPAVALAAADKPHAPVAHPVMALAAAAPVRGAAVEHGHAQAVAMLDRKLLSDTTLGDLTSGARAETASLR